MFTTRSHFTKSFLLAGGMGLALLSGCSGNVNEDEFLKSAPPGKPSEFPDESISQRRARTLGPSGKTAKGAADKTPTPGKAP
jgi:hypothetical protein